MAIERNPRNLRGFGNAIAPKSNMDYGFVDDQNRRQAQDKGIEAKEQQQQRNFKQRDKETRLDMLSKMTQLEYNWSPEIKGKINTKAADFVKGASDKTEAELMMGFREINQMSLAYNDIGKKMSTQAKGVASGKTYASNKARGLMSLKMEDDFSQLDISQGLSSAYGLVQTEYAPVLNVDGIDDMAEQLASKNETRMTEVGSTFDNKRVYETSKTLTEGDDQALQRFMGDRNSQLKKLYEQDNRELVLPSYKGNKFNIGTQIDKRFAPKADTKAEKPSYSYGLGGGYSGKYNYGVSEIETKVKAGSNQGYADETAWRSNKTLDITPEEGGTLKSSKIKNENGDIVTGTVVGVTDRGGELALLVTRNLSQSEQDADNLKQANKADPNFKILRGTRRDNRFSELISNGDITPRKEVTEEFDYGSNKNLVAPNETEIYKMMGDTRGYTNAEEVKEGGFGYFSKESGDDPISVDAMYELYEQQKRGDSTFGDFLHKSKMIPQEGEMSEEIPKSTTNYETEANKEESDRKEVKPSTKRNLEITQGLNASDREAFIGGRTSDMSGSGWNNAWSNLNIGEEMIGSDGETYIKE